MKSIVYKLTKKKLMRLKKNQVQNIGCPWREQGKRDGNRIFH